MTHQHYEDLQAGMNGLVSKPLASAAFIVEIARLAAAPEDIEAAAAALNLIEIKACYGIAHWSVQNG